MSITILPQEQLKRQSTNSIVRKIPLLFFPTPVAIYARRYERLKKLAENSPFSEYLQFCASIVDLQASLLKQMPINKDLSPILSSSKSDSASADDATTFSSIQAPLVTENYSLSTEWHGYLYQLLEQLLKQLPNTTEQIKDVVTRLQQNNEQQLQEKALALLQHKFSQIDSNEALFIWSALSLYYTQLASQIKGHAVSQNADKNSLCPVCNSLPVASIIHLGTNVGVRYLHCSLCESEWYVPRIKCTSCDNLKNIHYLSLDNELAASQAECCDDCHSYLKIFNQDREPHIDIIADDIASLILDIKTEEEGFFKTGLNPFLFAQEVS